MSNNAPYGQVADELKNGRFDPVADIEEFHRKFGLLYEGKPRLLPREISEFRARFMHEELSEYETCADAELLDKHGSYDVDVPGTLEDALDALVDLVYVALGTSHLHGFDFREAWRRVHAANMAKVRAERASDSKRGSTFDVVKPDGWSPPSHADLVANHAHMDSD